MLPVIKLSTAYHEMHSSFTYNFNYTSSKAVIT